MQMYVLVNKVNVNVIYVFSQAHLNEQKNCIQEYIETTTQTGFFEGAFNKMP